MNPVYAVIVAGGSGTRMGVSLPKQFLNLCGRPVLWHTIEAFLRAVPQVQIILVLPGRHIAHAQEVLQGLGKEGSLTMVPGGATRYESVQNGLKGLPDNALVMVHDGVRPMVSKALILRCLEKAKQSGSAIPVLPVTDSMRMLPGDGNSIAIDRETLRIIQTPQVFQSSLLLPAFRAAYRADFTDEASVVAANGTPLHFVEGERRNLKITTPDDLIIAEALLKEYGSDKEEADR